jgi:hypothetical protein
MKTLDGTQYMRALDWSGPQSAHTCVVSRAGGQNPLRVTLADIAARLIRVCFTRWVQLVSATH